MAKHFLEPVVHPEHFLYNKPNPALAQVLVSPRMKSIVDEYTSKVATTYVQRIAPRTKSGGLAEGVSAQGYIGGRKNDRWVGEVTSGAEYGGADEFGRHEYNPYSGSHALRDSLYSILPQRMPGWL